EDMADVVRHYDIISVTQRGMEYNNYTRYYYILYCILDNLFLKLYNNLNIHAYSTQGNSFKGEHLIHSKIIIVFENIFYLFT
ncbi:hypothetical protein OFM39_33055, partial [Escherichia coli]|nr:hypothetical protein [Escherichia coli]